MRAPHHGEGWTLIAAVNDDNVLLTTLLKSPDIDARCQVIAKRGFRSAGLAYNTAIAEAQNEILVFAHQDVYLPPGWWARVRRSLEQVEEKDPDWGVLGPVGVAGSGQLAGNVYSTGLRRIVGEPFENPVGCSSLDEMVLILQRSSNLRFDKHLPGFHLYGTDICLEASKRNLKSYVIPAFCIHNSNGIVRLPLPFWRAYLYLRRKWWDRLPIRTLCTTINKWCDPMVKSVLEGMARGVFNSASVGRRCTDPGRLYKELAEKYPGATL
jgi:Glycosyltransferase like family